MRRSRRVLVGPVSFRGSPTADDDRILRVAPQGR
jgi:hypothetical protein